METKKTLISIIVPVYNTEKHMEDIVNAKENLKCG